MFFISDTQISSSDQAMSVINFATICGAIFVFVYVTMEIPLLTPQNDFFCHICNRTKVVLYGGSVFCVYFVLWYRVHSAFYGNAITKHTISKPLQVLNYIAIVFIILMAGINLIIFLFAPVNLIISISCACQSISLNENSSIKWIVFVISTTAGQFILLFILIYPLYLHKKKVLNHHTDQKFIIPVVKRAVAVAGVCVLSDLLTFGFSLFYYGETLYIHHIVYSCNLMVNLMGVFLTSSNWREKLFPFKSNTDQTGTTSKTTDCNSERSSNTKATTYVKMSFHIPRPSRKLSASGKKL